MQMPSHDQYNPIQRLWLNGKEVFFASSDNGDGTSGVNSKWEFQQSTNGRLYVYAPENPANYFSNIEYPGGASTSSFYNHTVELVNADYVTLDGLDIRGSMYSSLGLAGSDFVTIKNCDLGNGSNWAGIYGNSTFINNLTSDKTSDNVVIENDTIDSHWNYAYYFYTLRTPYGILCGNGANHWIIRDNYIKDWWMNIHLVSSTFNGEARNIL